VKRALGLVLLACACVSSDVQETLPGAVFVRLDPPESDVREVFTDDGWLVRVERVVGTLGAIVTDLATPDPDARGDAAERRCASYWGGRESFGLVNVMAPFELEHRGHPAKRCLVVPAWIVSPVAGLLQQNEGVLAEDVEGLRSRPAGESADARVPSFRYARVQGRALRIEASVRFDWWIAENILDRLPEATAAELTPLRDAVLVRVPSGDVVRTSFALDPRQLFRVGRIGIDRATATRFGAFAALDEDHDGVVSSDELRILVSEVDSEADRYVLPTPGLSFHDVIALQLDAAWRNEASPR